MLRAQGGKMSARRRAGEREDNSACRDLSGRRLSVKRDAQRLAAYIQSEPERQKELGARQQARYQKLEKMLGRTPTTRKDFQDAAERLVATPHSLAEATEFDSADENEQSESSHDPQANALAVGSNTEGIPSASGTGPEPLPKARLNDHKFVEQSREVVAGARNAVALAMARKKSKAKALPPSTQGASTSPAHL